MTSPWQLPLPSSSTSAPWLSDIRVIKVYIRVIEVYFCRTVKTGLKSKGSIVLDAEQILVSYYYPFRNQWRRFLFRINEKLYKTKSNKNNYYHHTAFTACKQLEIVFLQTIPIINQVYFCSICFLLGGR